MTDGASRVLSRERMMDGGPMDEQGAERGLLSDQIRNALTDEIAAGRLADFCDETRAAWAKAEAERNS